MEKTLAAVHERLTKEIRFWSDRWVRLGEDAKAGKDVRLNLDNAGAAACDILNLDLGPLNLDLLGLQVDLSAIELDITAVPGPGNLLGNLLCSLAGLLDQGGPLNQIMRLITQINSLLR